MVDSRNQTRNSRQASAERWLIAYISYQNRSDLALEDHPPIEAFQQDRVASIKSQKLVEAISIK